MTTQHLPPAAVLWDMDGTLIDSEPYWIAAETALAHRYGVAWTHADGLSLVGNPLPVSAQMLRDKGVDMEIPEIVEYLLERVTAQVTESVPWQPDAKRLLDAVVAAGIPCALVTMSYTSLARAFTDQHDVFDVVVTGDTVTQGKPHPESYLTAATRLGVDIRECVAIEDSPSGIRAAHASGAPTIGVRRLTPLSPLEGMSRVRSLESVSLATLSDVVSGIVIDELGDEE